MRECIVCGEKFEGRADARFDKEACKKKYQRSPEKYDGTPLENTPAAEKIVVEPSKVKHVFKFKTKNSHSSDGFNEKDFRTATVWYDVPLGAVPFIYEGEPELPEYMNGRQYFLWRENNFKTTEKGNPVIINPTPPKKDKDGNILPSKYEMGGQGSRKWGA